MTITTRDPNRALWEARARGEDIPTWESLSPEPAGIEQESVDVPAGLWLRPPDAATGPVVLAIHGGGFVSGSVATHRRMFGHLARAAGVATLAVEYGLVPDHVFPSQLDTMLAAYGQLLDRGPTRVAVAGDSCGATLEATGASYGSGSDPFFTRELVRGLAAGYLAGADPRDPLAAPPHAALRRRPPPAPRPRRRCTLTCGGCRRRTCAAPAGCSACRWRVVSQIPWPHPAEQAACAAAWPARLGSAGRAGRARSRPRRRPGRPRPPVPWPSGPGRDGGGQEGQPPGGPGPARPGRR